MIKLIEYSMKYNDILVYYIILYMYDYLLFKVL